MMRFNILVQPIHVVQMLFVQNEMELAHVNVCLNTLAIHTVVAGHSVLQTVIAQAISPV